MGLVAKLRSAVGLEAREDEIDYSAGGAEMQATVNAVAERRLISQMIAQTRPSGEGTAALEIAAGLWGRSFASAVVTGGMNAMTPEVNFQIGRQLVIKGEAVFDIQVRNGQVQLDLASSHDITGPPDERAWRYRIDLPAPSGTQTVTRSSAQVLHVRINADRLEPHRGRSPVAASEKTKVLMELMEDGLGHEFAGPIGNIIWTYGTFYDTTAHTHLKTDIATMRGGVVVAGQDEDADSPPLGTYAGMDDYKNLHGKSPLVERIGPNVPSQIDEFRESVQASILMACGIPPALAAPDASAGSSREGLRLMLHATLKPISRLIEMEVARKIEPCEYDFSDLFASDITSRARAFKQLVDGGLPLAEARQVAGV